MFHLSSERNRRLALSGSSGRVAQTIDWDRFLGNAPKRPFDAARFFQFRNWWDYGTGIAGDEYVHLLSRVHYVLGVQYPLSAVANGGIYKWKGDRDVPDIHNTLYDYGKFQAQVSANLVSNWEGGEMVRFMGDRGTIELTEDGAKLVPYNPVEDYEYPLESWPKDTKDKFIAEHKNDPEADIGTARKQPQRKVETFKARTMRARWSICGICSNACKPGSNLWRTSISDVAPPSPATWRISRTGSGNAYSGTLRRSS